MGEIGLAMLRSGAALVDKRWGRAMLIKAVAAILEDDLPVAPRSKAPTLSLVPRSTPPDQGQ